MIKDLYNFIKIYDVGYTPVRIGNKKDGGYIVLDEISKLSNVVYSYGISDDISFEEDFQAKYPKNKIRMFDHTVSGICTNNSNLFFLKEGLSSYKTEQLATIEDHIQYYKDTNIEHKTLKIDIEWHEWDFFEKLNINTLKQFDQILCEFHIIPVVYKDSHSPYFTEFHKNTYLEINNMIYERYFNILKKIFSYYLPFHVHINNSLQPIIVNGIKVPSLVEISLVNKNLVKQYSPTTKRFPQPTLDYPNKTDRPDVSWSDLFS